MKTINFTQKHFNKLYKLAADALFNGMTFQTKLGQEVNIYELLHVISPNQLSEMRFNLSKKIEKMEEVDEWTDPNNEKLEEFKIKKELVNLVLGYKKFLIEQDTNRKERANLEAKLTELKEAQKTPEDRIKELEEKLKEYDSVENF